MSAEELHRQVLAHLQSGSPALARSAFSRLKALGPKSARLRSLESVLLEAEGDLAGALAVLEENPAGLSVFERSLKGRLLCRVGRNKEALSVLQFSLSLDPNQEQALHLFAALMESQSGQKAARASLLGLGNQEGAWLPHWVHFVLCCAAQDWKAACESLPRVAKRCPHPFPPDPQVLRDLFSRLEEPRARAVWREVRGSCHSAFQEEFDEKLSPLTSTLLSSASPADFVQVPGGISAGSIGRRHPVRLSLSPLSFMGPMPEHGPALERGYSLLLAESLTLEFGCVSECLFDVVFEGGLLSCAKQLTGPDLASRCSSSSEHLVRLYFSQMRETTILDAEVYDRDGNYLLRRSVRSELAGGCVPLMAEELARLLPTSVEHSWSPWPSGFELDDALARDCALAFWLCAEGSLAQSCLPNPGMSLELLAEYTARRQSATALATLWSAVQNGRRAGLEGCDQQGEILLEIIEGHLELRELLQFDLS